MELTQEMSQDYEDFGLLGGILQTCLVFVTKQCQLGERYYSPVVSEYVAGSAIFIPVVHRNTRWYMVHTDHLPGDPAIKAVLCSARRMRVETDPVNLREAQVALTDAKIPARFGAASVELSRKPFKKLITFERWTLLKGKKAQTEPRGPRTVFHLPWFDLDSTALNYAIRIFDTMYNQNTFTSPDYTGGADQGVPAGKQEMQLGLSTLQLIVQEQRPVFLLETKQELRTKQEGLQIQETSLRMMFAMQQRILTTPLHKLEEEVFTDTSVESMQRWLKAMHFVLAGRVKKARPDWSWSQARKQAWYLINQGTSRRH